MTSSLTRTPCRVGQYVPNIFELRAIFALRLLPNRPQLTCLVSGLVFAIVSFPTEMFSSSSTCQVAVQNPSEFQVSEMPISKNLSYYLGNENRLVP